MGAGKLCLRDAVLASSSLRFSSIVYKQIDAAGQVTRIPKKRSQLNRATNSQATIDLGTMEVGHDGGNLQSIIGYALGPGRSFSQAQSEQTLLGESRVERLTSLFVMRQAAYRLMANCRPT